jgi:hypothetical protein
MLIVYATWSQHSGDSVSNISTNGVSQSSSFFFVISNYIFSAPVTAVREARGFQQCADKCLGYHGYDLGAVACLAVCGNKYPNGRSLEYTADEVAVIKDPSTSAREARGTQACSENCYAKYGYGLEALGCLAGCNRRSLSQSLEYTPDVVVTSKREARDNKDKECAEKCASLYGGSGISTFGCYIDCKERNRGRSL